MSSANSNDILSAYYDREAAPNEEPAAKLLEGTSPEASRELKDYKQLSRLIQELPRVAAPPEFAAAVMQRAERESLIPIDAVASREPAQSNSESFGPRRRWIVAVASLVTVAASLLVAVFVFNRPWASGPRKEVARQEGIAAADFQPVSKESGPPPQGKDSFAPSVAAKSSGSSNHSSVLAAREKESLEKGHELALTLPANLKTARVGDVVEALQQDGQQVAVVRLTVVNQVEGLDGVQSLLVRNTSRTLQNADEIKRMRQQFPADKSADVPKAAIPASPGDMICVYAEGSRDEMLGVLQDLQTESHIQAAELTNTISVSTLEQYARRAVPADKQNAGGPAADRQIAKGDVNQSRQVVGSQLAVSLPASTVNKILSAGQRPSDFSSRSLNAAPAQLVQQNPAALDQTVLDQDRQKESLASDEGKAARPAQRPVPGAAVSRAVARQSNRSKSRNAQEVAAAQKSFQIFFVITDQPAAQTQRPALNAAKPAAAAPAKAPSDPSPPNRAP